MNSARKWRCSANGPRVKTEPRTPQVGLRATDEIGDQNDEEDGSKDAAAEIHEPVLLMS